MRQGEQLPQVAATTGFEMGTALRRGSAIAVVALCLCIRALHAGPTSFDAAAAETVRQAA